MLYRGVHGVNCKIRKHLQAYAIHIVFIIYKKNVEAHTFMLAK